MEREGGPGTSPIVAMDKSATIFMACSATIIGFIQKFCPPSERFFATAITCCCLTLFAAVTDPTTFFRTLFAVAPRVVDCLPGNWYDHIVKSIEMLEEGERRVAEMETKKGKDDGAMDTSSPGNGGTVNNNDDDYEVTTRMLLDEIRKRIQWKYVLPTIITTGCVQIIGYQKPIIVGRLMDYVRKDGASTMDDIAFWPRQVRYLVLYVIFDFILVSMREYYKHAAQHRYNAEIKIDMLTNLLDQEQDFITSDEHSTGFCHLMDRETQRMQSIVNGSIPRLVSAIICTVGGVYTLLNVDYRLALLGVIVKSPLLTMVRQLTMKDIVKYSKLYEASNGKSNRIARNILSPEVIHLLQSCVVQSQIVDTYRTKQEEFIHYLEYTHFRQTILCMVPHGMNNVQDILLLVVGLSSVMQGKLTLGSYITFRSQLSLLDRGPKELFGFWNDLVEMKMSSSVYFELMYRESRIPCSVPSCNGQRRVVDNTSDGLTLSLKNVSFAYHINPETKVLNDVDLVLRPNKIVALCGGSGGGKTTITRLLQRFYDPTEGSIEMNDIDIRSLDVAWLRSQIAVIDQDPILPDMTICENIALGLGRQKAGQDSQYVRDRVVEAAKLAEAHEFITTKCEKGYDTPVRLLHRLSGGQRQRIGIARALISRAKILICDEVTSALDADTEKVILSTLFDAMKGKSVLIIAHRMSTIRKADEILFLEHGQIVERGTHEELLLLNNRYASYLKTAFNHETSPCDSSPRSVASQR